MTTPKTMTKQQYWLAIEAEDGTLKLVSQADNSLDVMKLPRNEEFVEQHKDILGASLRVVILREEPSMTVKYEVGICPACKRPLDKESLIVSTVGQETVASVDETVPEAQTAPEPTPESNPEESTSEPAETPAPAEVPTPVVQVEADTAFPPGE